MRAALLLLLGTLTLVPAAAEAVWTLRTGPEAVGSIPLGPVQMVSAWRGRFGDGTDSIWVYATRSPLFEAPKSPDVVAVAGTPWTVVVFFPPAWKAADRSAWLDQWVAEFRTLASLPDPGYPVVFPSVLRKG